MIQLVSHQIKGQGCNQSLWEHVFFFFLSLHLFPLCLMLHLKVVNDPAFPFCDRDDSGRLNFWTNKVSTATNVSGCKAFFFFYYFFQVVSEERIKRKESGERQTSALKRIPSVLQMDRTGWSLLRIMHSIQAGVSTTGCSTFKVYMLMC